MSALVSLFERQFPANLARCDRNDRAEISFIPASTVKKCALGMQPLRLIGRFRSFVSSH